MPPKTQGLTQTEPAPATLPNCRTVRLPCLCVARPDHDCTVRLFSNLNLSLSEFRRGRRRWGHHVQSGEGQHARCTGRQLARNFEPVDKNIDISVCVCVRERRLDGDVVDPLPVHRVTATVEVTGEARHHVAASILLQYPKDLIAVEGQRGVRGCWFVEREVRKHDDPIATLARLDDMSAQPLPLTLAAAPVEGHVASLRACEVVEEVDALFLVKHWIRVVFPHQTRGLLVPGKYLVLQEADFI
mmetsp:Transcript_23094/g.74789  ORF Transcript_23094/g.74789 Transcript_23094/m.74789 type:complete len:244 (+) Transcript_23094:250-981(+)